MALKIGILALQGCVTPHIAHIEKLGAQAVQIRYAEELDEIQGLILPGGESTTMLKLLDVYELKAKLAQTIERVPTWGICAGAILLSQGEQYFSQLGITVERNAYGSQKESFQAVLNNYGVSFIRAPQILKVRPTVQILAHYENHPVWVQERHLMATTFHPELNLDAPSPMHQLFLEKIQSFL
jgi:5'-phosphate synthase pdxT subunit